eukprot:gene7375-8158_t
MATPEEIEKFLCDRLEAIRIERTAAREAFNTLDGKIKTQKKAMGPAPRDTVESLTAAITALEKQYTRTSHNKAEERTFLYELDKLKQKKKAALAYSKQNAEAEAMKAQLHLLRTQLLEKETAMDELLAGLKKVRIAAKVKVANQAIAERVYKLSDLVTTIAQTHPHHPTLTPDELEEAVEHAAAKIIGKSGSTIKYVEDNYNVSLTLSTLQQRDGEKVLTILGTPEDIVKVYEYLYVLCDTVNVDLSVTEACVTYLLSNKFNLVQELQTKHNVKIDLSSVKNNLRIVGLTNQVEAAKADIQTINRNIIRSDLELESGHLAFIIGKQGSHIKSIESEYAVLCQIDKEKKRLSIVGVRTNVHAAGETIRASIQENKEVEETLSFEKHVFLGAFISTMLEDGTTNVLRGISRDFGVRIDSEGGEKEKASEAGPVLYQVKVKGQNFKVQTAVHRLREVATAFQRDTTTIALDEDTLPILLGKGGSTIKALREKYNKVAHLDVVDGQLYLHAENKEVRAMIEKEIGDLLDQNYTTTIDKVEDWKFGLMSKLASFQTMRQQLSQSSAAAPGGEGAAGVVLYPLRKAGQVKLKGRQSLVQPAERLIRAYLEDLSSEALEIEGDDLNLFLRPLNTSANANADVADAPAPGGNDNKTLLRVLEDQHEVDITLDRKSSAGSVKEGPKSSPVKLAVQGRTASVTQALAHIRGIILGQSAYNAALLLLPSLALPALIGRAGQQLRKLEAETGVFIEVSRQKAAARLFVPPGTSAARSSSGALETAREVVLSFCNNTRVSDRFVIHHGQPGLHAVPHSDEAQEGGEMGAGASKERPTGVHLLIDCLARKALDLYRNANLFVDCQLVSPHAKSTKVTLRGSLLAVDEARRLFTLFFDPASYKYSLAVLPAQARKLADRIRDQLLPKPLIFFQQKHRITVEASASNDSIDTISYHYENSSEVVKAVRGGSALINSNVPATAAVMEWINAVLTKESVVRQALYKVMHTLFTSSTAFLEAPRSFLLDVSFSSGTNSSSVRLLSQSLSAVGVKLTVDFLKGILFIAGDEENGLHSGMHLIDHLLASWNATHVVIPVNTEVVWSQLVSPSSGKADVQALLSQAVAKLSSSQSGDANAEGEAEVAVKEDVDAKTEENIEVVKKNETEKDGGKQQPKGDWELIVDRHARTITLTPSASGSSAGLDVQEVGAALAEIVLARGRGQAEVAFPCADIVPLFIGKQGAHITALRKECGVSIEVLNDNSGVRLLGEEEKVLAAVKRVEAFLASEEVTKLTVQRVLILPTAGGSTNTSGGGLTGALIGSGGTRIKEWEGLFGVRLEVEKPGGRGEGSKGKSKPSSSGAARIKVRGPLLGCQEAIDAIQSFLSEAGYEPAYLVGSGNDKNASDVPGSEEESEQEDEEVEQNGAVVVANASGSSAPSQPAVNKQLSKSSMRRLRRKLAAQQAATEAAVVVDDSSATVAPPSPTPQQEEEEEVVPRPPTPPAALPPAVSAASSVPPVAAQQQQPVGPAKLPYVPLTVSPAVAPQVVAPRAVAQVPAPGLVPLSRPAASVPSLPAPAPLVNQTFSMQDVLASLQLPLATAASSSETLSAPPLGLSLPHPVASTTTSSSVSFKPSDLLASLLTGSSSSSSSAPSAASEPAASSSSSVAAKSVPTASNGFGGAYQPFGLAVGSVAPAPVNSSTPAPPGFTPSAPSMLAGAAVGANTNSSTYYKSKSGLTVRL